MSEEAEAVKQQILEYEIRIRDYDRTAEIMARELEVLRPKECLAVEEKQVQDQMLQRAVLERDMAEDRLARFTANYKELEALLYTSPVNTISIQQQKITAQEARIKKLETDTAGSSV